MARVLGQSRDPVPPARMIPFCIVARREQVSWRYHHSILSAGDSSSSRSPRCTTHDLSLLGFAVPLQQRWEPAGSRGPRLSRRMSVLRGSECCDGQPERKRQGITPSESPLSGESGYAERWRRRVHTGIEAGDSKFLGCHEQQIQRIQDEISAP